MKTVGKKSRGRWAFFLFALLLILTGGRIFLSLQDGVSAREAYFWLLGEHWEWASMEGPGGGAALVAGLRIFLGPRPELLGAISPLAIFLASVGLWIWARRWAGPGWAVWIVAAWNVLPGVQVASGHFGAEPLLWACWMWFFVCVTCAMQGRILGGMLGWTLAGLVAGFGVLVSYYFLLAPLSVALGVALFWLSERKVWRRWWKKWSRNWERWRTKWWSRATRWLDRWIPEIGCRIASKRTPESSLPIVTGNPSPAEVAKSRLLGGPGWWLILLLPGVALVGPFSWEAETGWIAWAGATWQSLLNFGGWHRVLAACGQTAAAGGWFLFFWAMGLFAVLKLVAWRELSGVKDVRDPMVRWWVLLSLLPGAWMVLDLWRGEDATHAFLLWLPTILIGWASHYQHHRHDEETKEENGEPLRRASFSTTPKLAAGAVFLTAAWTAWMLSSPADETEPDWAALAERVQRVAHMFQPAGERPVFLIAGEADTAAALGFYLLERTADSQESHGRRRDFPPVYLKESQNAGSQFALWPRYDAFVEGAVVVEEGDEFFTEQKGVNPNIGRSAIYVGTEMPLGLPQVIANGFVQVIPLERVRDAGGRVFYLYFCLDYQTAPL